MATQRERSQIVELRADVKSLSRRVGNVEQTTKSTNEKITQLAIDVGVLKEVRKLSSRSGAKWGGIIAGIITGLAAIAQAVI